VTVRQKAKTPTTFIYGTGTDYRYSIVPVTVTELMYRTHLPVSLSVKRSRSRYWYHYSSTGTNTGTSMCFKITVFCIATVCFFKLRKAVFWNIPSKVLLTMLLLFRYVPWSQPGGSNGQLTLLCHPHC
jgi:hypothetical protein